MLSVVRKIPVSVTAYILHSMEEGDHQALPSPLPVPNMAGIHHDSPLGILGSKTRVTAPSTPSFSQVRDTFLIDPPLWFEHLCAACMSESPAVLSVVNRPVFQNIP